MIEIDRDKIKQMGETFNIVFKQIAHNFNILVQNIIKVFNSVGINPHKFTKYTNLDKKVRNAIKYHKMMDRKKHLKK